eukprot:838407-Prymnesium_polylepis.1
MEKRTKNTLRSIKEVHRVDGVRTGELEKYIHGIPPTAMSTDDDERHRRGLGRLASLVSHLMALESIAKHFASTASLHVDPLAVVVQDDFSLEFAQWWGRVGVPFDSFMADAPPDWQMLQLAPVADSALWRELDRAPIGLNVTRLTARWSSLVAPAGLGCYAVRASTAMYFTRTFLRHRRWDVLPYFADAQRR